MYKKLLTLLIGFAMLSTLALAGCNTGTNQTDIPDPTNASITVTEATNASEQATSHNETTTEADTEAATSANFEDEITLIEDDDEYEYIDETVTNPTAAPIESPDENATASSEVTPATLAGSWKPLIAVSVADNQEATFQEIYGSSYSQYGGSLEIAEDGSFKISMGASITENKSSGTFTTSQNNLLVTYADGSVDTYLYIPQYQNNEVIKTQVDNYYIYFYKVA